MILLDISLGDNNGFVIFLHPYIRCGGITNICQVDKNKNNMFMLLEDGFCIEQAPSFLNSIGNSFSFIFLTFLPYHNNTFSSTVISSFLGLPDLPSTLRPLDSIKQSIYCINLVLSPVSKILLYNLNLERSEEHTSELQSRPHLVCRLLLEKKKKKTKKQQCIRKKKI